jgi:hypothetical protein
MAYLLDTNHDSLPKSPASLIITKKLLAVNGSDCPLLMPSELVKQAINVSPQLSKGVIVRLERFVLPFGLLKQIFNIVPMLDKRHTQRFVRFVLLDQVLNEMTNRHFGVISSSDHNFSSFWGDSVAIHFPFDLGFLGAKAQSLGNIGCCTRLRTVSCYLTRVKSDEPITSQNFLRLFYRTSA